VTIDVRGVVGNYGDTIVRGAYEGEYDKTKLPARELIMSSYFGVRDEKIPSLIIINTQTAIVRQVHARNGRCILDCLHP
jgi:hypothetical protein